MNSRAFYCLAGGLTAGIFFSSFFKLGFSFFLFLLVLSVLIFIFSKWLAKSNINIILLSIFIFSLALGILRYEISEIRNVSDTLYNQVGEKVTIQGIISDEPRVGDKSTRLIVVTDSEKVLVTVGLFPEYKYGDKIRVGGKLERPQNFITNTGKDFDYVDFLAKDDIFYQINFAQVELISTGHGSFIKTKLFAVKNAFMAKINILIKEPESALLGGLLLGAKNSLGQDLQNDFRLAGVSHIVALSGYNITIVAEGIMTTLSFLPRIVSISFGVLGIIFFAIMTGGGATVLRASIMALLVLLARSTGRRYDVSRALLLAGVFMLIQNPKILVFDLSFQLSFLATLALILVSPIVERKMTFITERYKIRELVVATVSTQIFVMPFLLYKMGLFSVYALFTNILILPVIPMIMFLGFLAGIFGFVAFVIAAPLAIVCSLLLTYVLKIIYLFSHLPYSSIVISNFSFFLMVFIYVIIFVIIWYSLRFSPKEYEKY